MSNLPTIVSLVLAVIALALALWQTRLSHRQMDDARNMSKEMRSQTEKMIAIGNALSTRYLGSFPEFISEIANAISKVTRDLRIVCTIPTTAVYSNPDGWFVIKQALQRTLGPSSNVKVSCVFADAKRQETFLKAQYSEAYSNWQFFRSMPSNASKIKEFHFRYGNGNLENLTSQGFFNLFSIAATEELKTTFKGSQIVQIPFHLPLNIWIVDKKEAVFAILSTAPSFLAEAFWTTDSDLIGALLQLHTEYCEKGLQQDQNTTQ